MQTMHLAPSPTSSLVGRRTKLLYWVVTGLLALLMLLDGVAGLLREKNGQLALAQLGYPVYFLSILGTAKLLGALALVLPVRRTLREWAYAGFTFNFLSAAASWLFVAPSVAGVVAPAVALALLLTSHWLWKRQEAK